jgi:tetratricopeptide (TPR) repeat protein
MKKTKLLRIGLVAALLAVSVAAGADESVRPEIGKPLQAAQELIKAGKYKEAMAKINDADAVPNKTAYESLILERMRGAAASGAGDTAAAIKSLEAALASDRLTGADRLRTQEALIGSYYRAKEYAKVVSSGERYAKEGGSNPQIRLAVIQAQYLTNDFSGAARELLANIQETEKAGQAPSEDQLQLLASCYLRMNDNTGYVNVLEKLIVHYPKKTYWPDLLSRVQRKPGFSDRYTLDVYRLMFAAGAMKDGSDYVDMAQLALQIGQPAEAKKAVDEGYAKGLLGSGADAARHTRLRDLANKQLATDSKAMAENERQAKDPNALSNVGYAYVMLGQADKGLALMEQALVKDGIKRPAEARLHLAEAYLLAGQKDKALQTFKTVQGNDGAGDLARLWGLFASRE